MMEGRLPQTNTRISIWAAVYVGRTLSYDSRIVVTLVLRTYC